MALFSGLIKSFFIFLGNRRALWENFPVNRSSMHGCCRIPKTMANGFGYPASADSNRIPNDGLAFEKAHSQSSLSGERREVDLHFWWQGLIPHVLLSLPRKYEPYLHSHRWISNWKKTDIFLRGVANLNNMICPFILNATTGEVWMMPAFRIWDMLHVDHISSAIHLK